MTDHVDSYYAATACGLEEFPALQGDVTADVCVIGGGYTGLSAALHLAEKGYSVVLLEANRVGWGASGRNGGQVGSGQRKSQDELEEMVSRDDARLLWDFSEEAKRTVKDLIAKHDIPCDWTPGILEALCKEKEIDDARDHVNFMHEEYGYDKLRYVEKGEMREMVDSPLYYGGVIDTDAGHVHPLNLALGYARAAKEAGVRIFEQSRVKSYSRESPSVVETEKGRVKATYIVIGCNGYLEKLEKRVAGKIMPINNFVLATEPLGEDRARSIIRDNVAVADSYFVINYYRFSADNRMLFGGGENYTMNFPKDVKSFVRPHMLKTFPQLADVKIDYGWGGTLAVTLNRMPHFERLDPNVFVAQGFSGHGVALTCMAGKVIAEAVAGTAERFDVFARVPTPTFPGGTLLRWPGLVAGMFYHSMLDRIG